MRSGLCPLIAKTRELLASREPSLPLTLPSMMPSSRVPSGSMLPRFNISRKSSPVLDHIVFVVIREISGSNVYIACVWIVIMQRILSFHGF